MSNWSMEDNDRRRAVRSHLNERLEEQWLVDRLTRLRGIGTVEIEWIERLIGEP